VASPPDERIPRPDQNFISCGLARDGERKSEAERECSERAKAEEMEGGGE